MYRKQTTVVIGRGAVVVLSWRFLPDHFDMSVTGVRWCTGDPFYGDERMAMNELAPAQQHQADELKCSRESLDMALVDLK